MTDPTDADERHLAELETHTQHPIGAPETDTGGPTSPLSPPVMMTAATRPDIGVVEDDAPQSFGRQAWRRFRHHKLAMIGVVILVLLVVGFFVMPLLSPYTIDEINILDRAQGPSAKHWFGTDDLGRDLFVRAMIGGQYSMIISVMSGILAAVIAAMLGIMAGYFGGFVDSLVNWMINFLLTVNILVLLLIVAVKLPLSPWVMALIIASLVWYEGARVIRSVVLQYKEREFVLAARAAGATPWRIMARHLLPNVASAFLVNATLLAGTAIIFESTLAFLGAGVPPPDTTLGTLVNEGKGSIDTNPSRVLIPGLLITLIILSINFIGDGMRDALDPTHEMGD